jgi:dipeptidase E
VTERHIVAMGGGQDVGDPVFRYASDLVDRPRPKVCLVPTAASAVPISVMRFLSVFPADAFEPTYLDLFDRDDRDLRDFVCSQDLIFVGGAIRPTCSRCGGSTDSTTSCARRGSRVWCWQG